LAYLSVQKMVGGVRPFLRENLAKNDPPPLQKRRFSIKIRSSQL